MTDEVLFRLTLNQIIHKASDESSIPGVPPFSRGFYKVTSITKSVNGRPTDPDRDVYVLTKCSKTGKLYKTEIYYNTTGIHKMLDQGEIQVKP